MTLLWNNNPEGILSADVGLYRLTVQRLLPAADSRFIIRKNDRSEAAVASGIQPSTKDAMEHAEEVAHRLLGIAVVPQSPSDRPSSGPP